MSHFIPPNIQLEIWKMYCKAYKAFYLSTLICSVFSWKLFFIMKGSAELKSIPCKYTSKEHLRKIRLHTLQLIMLPRAPFLIVCHNSKILLPKTYNKVPNFVIKSPPSCIFSFFQCLTRPLFCLFTMTLIALIT